MRISFSVNAYDKEGDCFDEGIFIWLGNMERTILRFGDLAELEDFAKQILHSTVPEIKESYGLKAADDE